MTDTELVLPWVRGVPDGLCAYAPLPPSGVYPRDRLGRPKPKRVRLRSAETPPTPARPDGISDSDWNWLTSTSRNWTTVSQRLGENAYPMAVTLARTGCLTIEHDLNLSALVQPPRRLHPHPDLARSHTDAREHRRHEASTLRTHAVQLATTLADEWPGAAAALRTTTHPDRLTWIINAATDLADGRIHDSVRAFVQVHAGHTKARDDVHHLLAEVGFEPDAIAALGLARNPYIGLGGPLELTTNDGVLALNCLPGPHDIRLPGGRVMALRLTVPARTLLVIENRQAAESACDAYPGLPVVWCHGQPAAPILDLIAQAAEQAHSVLLCPDADLGGVRIAARIYDHLTPGHNCRILDVGDGEHSPGREFNSHSRTHLTALAERKDVVGRFANACLTRGYAVEQEAAAKTALRAIFGNLNDRHARWRDTCA
jgi:hypothetical protein